MEQVVGGQEEVVVDVSSFKWRGRVTCFRQGFRVQILYSTHSILCPRVASNAVAPPGG